MKKYLFSIAFLAAVSFVSCKKEAVHQSRQIDKARWLIGNWENKTQQGDLSENWTALNDSVYHGESYFIKGKDTLFGETVALTHKGSDVYYTVTAKGQNDELPVAFKMTRATATELIFENPKHDFPTKITYQRVGNDSLVAAIFGTQNGKPVSETYPMSKK